jgi:ABC-type glycerol-3-phosphate transport system substrate-binding protein
LFVQRKNFRLLQAPSGLISGTVWEGNWEKRRRSIIAAFNESQSGVFVTGVQQSSYQETERQLQAAAAANKVPAVTVVRVYVLDTFASRGITAILSLEKCDKIPSWERDYLADCWAVWKRQGKKSPI